MNANQHLRLVPYARTSQEKGRPHAEQERDYRTVVDAWHERHPNVTLRTFEFDHGKTGGKLAGRDALMRALRQVAEGEADGILVPKASRLGRNLRESLNVIAALREGTAATGPIAGFEDLALPGAGVFLPLDVPGAEDPDNGGAGLTLNIWLSMAEHELVGYKAQWYARKRRWAEDGGHLGRAPTGYRHRDQPRGSTPKLEPDPVTADAVREVFRLAATGDVAGAARHLGLPPSKLVGQTSTRRPSNREALLANRVYLGESSWHDARTGEDVIVRGAHEPLVSPGTFARVQRVLAGESVVAGRAPGGRYPLSGAVRCARCGQPIVGSSSAGRRTYRCGSGGGGAAVKCGSFAVLLADQLEPELRARLVAAAREAEAAIEQYAGTDDLEPGLGLVGGGNLADHALAPADVADAEAQAAVEQAEADLREAHELPERFRALAVADAEAALGEAQARLEAVVAASEAEAVPEWVELAGAPLERLGQLAARLGFVPVVSPDRGATTQRLGFPTA